MNSIECSLPQGAPTRAAEQEARQYVKFGPVMPIKSAGYMNIPNSKILLVEDSKMLRLANERVLVRAGYEVTTAQDGEEALRVAEEMHPDLILLDMLLPKLSGPEVLRALKAN